MKTTITIEDQGAGVSIEVAYDPPLVIDSVAPMSPALDMGLAAMSMLMASRCVATPLGFNVIQEAPSCGPSS